MIKNSSIRIVLILLLCGWFSSSQAQGKLGSIKAFQEKLNREFKDPERSPLTPKDRATFMALEFFPPDTSFSVVAEFVRTPFETPFEMPTTTERKPVYVKYGELYFTLKGQEYKLDIYQTQVPIPGYEDHLFLPFTDLTNGETSYAGGRYVDMSIPRSSRVVLDFNKAYNPYCAYNGAYSCPIPPKENHLELAITAGVKAYGKE